MITMMKGGAISALFAVAMTATFVVRRRRMKMKLRNNGLTLLIAEVTPEFKREFDEYLSAVRLKNKQQRAITKRLIIGEAITEYIKRNPA